MGCRRVGGREGIVAAEEHSGEEDENEGGESGERWREKGMEGEGERGGEEEKEEKRGTEGEEREVGGA